MKLYHCCLLIFVACVVAAEEEDNVAEQLCDLELQKIELQEKLCKFDLTGQYEFQLDYNSTIAKYNENGVEAAEVQEFLDKYCGMMTEFLNCSSSIDTSEAGLKCKELPAITKIQPTSQKGVQLIVNYGCDNSAENLKKLLPHDGFNLIFFNENIERCHSMSSSVDTLEGFCATLDEARSCYLEVAGDHPNENIPVMINEVFATTKTAVGC